MAVTLILGGARSGKSQRAESLAGQRSAAPVYVATAPLLLDDQEWQARLAHHRARRGKQWRLIEEELDLAAVLAKEAASADAVVVVDCITLWLSNMMFAQHDVTAEAEKLCTLLPSLAGDVILVSNEVGMGVVPEQALGRAFRDAQGRINQQLAASAHRVEWMMAGLSLSLK